MAKKKDTMTDITINGIIGTSVVSAMPSTSAAAGIKTGYATGVSNVGSKLPAIGKVKGTGMVMKSTGKLKSGLKKLNFKGGYKL